MRRISRRKFLALGAASLGLSARAGAAGPSRKSVVLLIKTADRADGIRRALKAVALQSPLGKGVVIKPNFNSSDPFPASTHPDALLALIAELRARGARAITVADRSGMGDTREVMQEKGIFDLARREGFNATVLDALPPEQWVPEPLGGGHWRRGILFPKPLADAELLISTCCLKTHRFGGHFTMSLKNSVGMVAKYGPGDGYDYMGELHGSRHQRRMIAEINQPYRPALVVMDGLKAFADGGPERGRLVEPGVIVAGTDRIAVDAVGVAILRLHGSTPQVMGGRVFDQEQIARAVQLGLGARSAEEMEVAADDREGEELAERVRAVLKQG